VARAYKKGTLADGITGTISGGVVGFYSLKMPSKQLAARILSEACEVPSQKIRRGDITEDYQDSLEWYCECAVGREWSSVEW